LNILQEVWDLIEADSELIQENYTSQGTNEQLFMVLSVAALSGSAAPRTLKIRGVIQGLVMLILIDSGSSHFFISENVAVLLQGVTPV
jgi:hypothetical protein